jgi:hypothetical protein
MNQSSKQTKLQDVQSKFTDSKTKDIMIMIGGKHSGERINGKVSAPRVHLSGLMEPAELLDGKEWMLSMVP